MPLRRHDGLEIEVEVVVVGRLGVALGAGAALRDADELADADHEEKLSAIGRFLDLGVAGDRLPAGLDLTPRRVEPVRTADVRRPRRQRRCPCDGEFALDRARDSVDTPTP